MPGLFTVPGLPPGMVPSVDLDGWETVGAGRKGKKDAVKPPATATAAANAASGGGLGSAMPFLGPGMGPMSAATASFVGKPSALLGTPTPINPPAPAAAPALTPAPAAAPKAEKPTAGAAAPAAAGKKPSPSASGKWDEDAKKIAKSLLTEFFTVGDLSEAMLCVSELGAAASQEVSSGFVEFAAMLALEGGKDRDCAAIGRLLSSLAKPTKPLPGASAPPPAPLLADGTLTAGVLSLAEQLDDLALDFPTAPRVLGEWMGTFLADGAVTAFDVVSEACGKSYDGARRRAVLLAVLKALQGGEKGEGDVVAKLKDSGAKGLVKVVTEEGQDEEKARERLEADLKSAGLALELLSL